MRPAKRAWPAFVGIAMVAALVAGTGPSSGGQTPTEDDSVEPAGREQLAWSGYRIDRTGKASGGWIGARRWGRNGPVLYRIDPAASARTTTYRSGHWVSRLRALEPRSTADRRDTARAGWILSKYGTFRYDSQSAAVDAALLHLLAGDRWSLRGDLGARRIRQSVRSAEVRSFARIMLNDSLLRSGPYAIEVHQQDVAIIGEPVRLAIRVFAARNGHPLPYVPVQVATPDGVTNAGKTSKDGPIGLTYDSPPAGALPIKVSVGQAPEARLRLLAPVRPSASRVVVAGRKGRVTGYGVAYVKARPRVLVSAKDTRIPAGGKNKGRFRLLGSAEAWPRRAVVTLHGPFADPQKVQCGPRTTRKAHVRVTKAGHYSLPRYTLRKEAIYVWQVRVPGNRVNLPADVCGGRFRVVAK